MLRISDVLLRNLIWATVTLDSNITRDSSKYRDILLEKIKGCGITFRVSDRINGDCLTYNSHEDMEIQRYKRRA